MAGFALVMAVLTYGSIGIVVAGILSLVVFSLARRKLRDESRTDRNLVIKVGAAPFLGLASLIAALLIHVEISNRFAHQDCGFSGDPYVTLPNGYEVGSQNTYDGYIRAPGAKTDAPVAGPGYVRSIISLQLTHHSFTGTQFDFKTSAFVVSHLILRRGHSSLLPRDHYPGARLTMKLSWVKIPTGRSMPGTDITGQITFFCS